MTDLPERLRNTLARKPGASRVELTREGTVALLDEIDRLRAAARDVVLAYQEANPVRTADMHPATCGCLRCEIDRLDHVSGESR